MSSEKRNSCGNVVYEDYDKNGDEFSVEFYGNELIEITAFSQTGCIVLESQQALELANKIIERLSR